MGENVLGQFGLYEMTKVKLITCDSYNSLEPAGGLG